jgi:hypothetical protein
VYVKSADACECECDECDECDECEIVDVADGGDKIVSGIDNVNGVISISGSYGSCFSMDGSIDFSVGCGICGGFLVGCGGFGSDIDVIIKNKNKYNIL